MDDQGELATRLEAALAASGARLDGGLSGKELASIEARYRFVFAPDHRLLLTLALPLGDDRRWPDWRHGSEEDLRGRVAWPVDGLLFDVEHNSLRLPGWPDRPSPMADALAVAAEQLRSVPPLAPLCSHRYVPTVPAEAGNPVLSCYQADVIYYGQNLLDWFDWEFSRRSSAGAAQSRRVPFWSDIVEADF